MPTQTPSLPNSYEKLLQKNVDVEQRQIFGVEFKWTRCPLKLLKYPILELAGKEIKLDADDYEDLTHCLGPSGRVSTTTYIWHTLLAVVRDDITQTSNGQVDLMEMFDLLSNRFRYFMVPIKTQPDIDAMHEATRVVATKYQVKSNRPLQFAEFVPRWHSLYLSKSKKWDET